MRINPTVAGICIIVYSITIFAAFNMQKNNPPRNATVTATAITCHAKDSDVFPDPSCTPANTNPAVTQATVALTICLKGWATSQRPPVTQTEYEKFKSMKQYGDPTTTGQVSLYEFDHMMPIELGGAVNSTGNLWPELHKISLIGFDYGSYTKDRVENALKRKVCSGILTLAAAQSIVRLNWTQGLKYVPIKRPALPNP